MIRGGRVGAAIKQKSRYGGPTMAITKRDFLLGAAAASGGIMFSRIDASGQAERRVIDAHTHWYPAQWVELVQNEGEAAGARIGRNDRGGITFNAGGISAVFSPNYIDLESRIKSMDETGINAQVLSLMGPDGLLGAAGVRAQARPNLQ